jgi:hypothetical protein
MARAPKSNAAQGRLLDQSSLECPEDFTLGLKPAELEALLERLCCCSTLRLGDSGRARSDERCPHRVRKEWCRIGERRADSTRVETRFG